MDDIIIIIIVIAAALGVLALILKLLAKFPIVNYVVLFGVALTMLIMGFVCSGAKENEGEFNGILAVTEGTILFAYMIFGYADIALDRTEYYETTASYNEWSDTVTVSSRLASSSNFWGCLGISAATGYGVSFFVHGIFKSAAGSAVFGIIGIVATLWSAIRIISFIRGYLSVKKERKDYY